MTARLAWISDAPHEVNSRQNDERAENADAPLIRAAIGNTPPATRSNSSPICAFIDGTLEL